MGTWEQARAEGDLEGAARLLRLHLAEDPADARALVELGILEKLAGRIEPAFALLRRGLQLLGPEDPAARQRAQFVLGLTWGDVRQPEAAVRCFEAAAAARPHSREARAARDYARMYRAVFLLT